MRIQVPKDVQARSVLSFLTLATFLAMSACSWWRSSDRVVWAEVDGNPIYRDQVERVYRSRVPGSSDPGGLEQALSFKLSILNELINNQILVAQAARSRITVSEAEVDTKIAELQSPYSKEEFQKRLSEQNLGMGELRQEIRRSLLINRLVNKEISSRVSVTDEEIAAYYERNKSTFNVPETQYHIAQIEVTPGPDPEVRNLKNDDAKNPRDADRKIQALYARLRSGEDFATVAQEYSEDPRTAAGGGDMGFIPVSTLSATPQLRQAVTPLKPEEFAPVYRDSTGYHIVKLLGKDEAGQLELSNPHVQTAIRQALMHEKEQLLKAAYIDVLRNRAEVENYLAEQVVSGDATRAPQKERKE